MKEKDIKNYIDENKAKFPLSYIGAIYRKDEKESIFNGKITVSKRYNTTSFPISKFYKPISRL